MTDGTTTSPNTRGASKGSRSRDSSNKDLPDHLKSLITIAQISGSGLSRIPCPFCSSGDRDMQLSHSRDTYYCFRCNRNGDIISWIMEEDSVTYGDAIKKLCVIAGISLNPPKSRIDALTKAMSVYKENLRESPRAQEFLLNRGIRPETWFNCGIGYAEGIPEGIALRELMDVRLVNQETSRAFYQDRIIFAIHSRKGEVVHMQGRSLDGSEPKYMQLPGSTSLGEFPISNYLYGEEFLDDPSPDAFILEGIPDTLIVRQYGLYAFGVLGKQGFVKHAPKLRRAKRIHVILDNDKASRGVALEQLIDLQLRLPTVRIYDVVLPKDPDQEKQDVNSWYLENACPSVDTFWDMIRTCRRPILEAAVQDWGGDIEKHERLVQMIVGRPDPHRWLDKLAAVSGETLSSLMYLARIVEKKYEHTTSAGSISVSG